MVDDRHVKKKKDKPMLLEFQVQQGSTFKLHQINLRMTEITDERLAITEDLTALAEQYNEYEDATDYIITNLKGNAKNDYDLSLKNFQSEVDTAYKNQTEAKKTLDGFNSTISDLQSKIDNAEKGGTGVAKEHLDNWKTQLKTAQEAQKEAQETYDNATKKYETEKEASNNAQKQAYQNYQDELAKVEQTQKSMKNVAKSAKDANEKALNKKDARLETVYNLLSAQQEMLKEEQKNAEGSVQEQASKLAPKY